MGADRYPDLTGRRFGMLTVLDRAETSRSGSRLWQCRCDCGGSSVVPSANLTSGHTGSCGCRAPRPKDLAGRRFGRLVALEPSAVRVGGRPSWTCRCDCGATLPVMASRLICGNTRSCGCLQRDEAAASGQRATSKVHPRTCPHCGAAFLGTNKQIYCSGTCKEADALAPREERPCLSCGAMMWARRDQEFCSERCKNRFHRAKRTRVGPLARQVAVVAALAAERGAIEDGSGDREGDAG